MFRKTKALRQSDLSKWLVIKPIDNVSNFTEKSKETTKSRIVAKLSTSGRKSTPSSSTPIKKWKTFSPTTTTTPRTKIEDPVLLSPNSVDDSVHEFQSEKPFGEGVTKSMAATEDAEPVDATNQPTKSKIDSKLSTASTGEKKSAPSSSSPSKKRMKYSTTAIETPKFSRDDSIICLDDSFEESKREEKPIDEASSFTGTKATVRKDVETKDSAIKITMSKNLDPINGTKSKIDSKSSTGDKKSTPSSSTPVKKKKYTTTIENPVLSPNDSIFNDSFDELKRLAKPFGEGGTKSTTNKMEKDAATKVMEPINATKQSSKSKIDSKSSTASTSEKKSAPSSSTPIKKKKKYTTTIENPVLSPNDSIFNDSFDELKRPEKPIGEVVVRKKDERCKLQGHECPCCKDYYDSLGLSPESRARRVNQISRHRKTYRPYKRVKTPEHFWDLEIPDTQECIRRGYLKRNF